MKFGTITKTIEKFISRELTREENSIIEFICFCNHELNLPSEDYLQSVVKTMREQQKKTRIAKLKKELEKIEND